MLTYVATQVEMKKPAQAGTLHGRCSIAFRIPNNGEAYTTTNHPSICLGPTDRQSIFTHGKGEPGMIKTTRAINTAFSNIWRTAKKANKTDEKKTTGIDNPKLWNRYLRELDSRSQFWYEMAVIQATASLRNVSVREMTFDQYDPQSGLLRVTGVKCQRAKWTKEVNKILREEWLEELKSYLETIYTSHRQYAVITLADCPKKLIKALKIRDTADIEAMQAAFISTERYQAEYARVMASDNSAGHEYVFDGEAKRIMDRRHAQAKARHNEQGTDGYLFPALELGANRAMKDAPVTRQTALNSLKAAWESVAEWASKKGGAVARAAKECVFGLHSLRKQLPKLLFNAGVKLEELSKRLGHADSTMVFNYINSSKATNNRKVREHTDKATQLGFEMCVSA